MVIIADPIGDMLIRVKNAYMVERKETSVPLSKEKEAVAKVLVETNIIEKYEVIGEGIHKELQLKLRTDRKTVLEVKRISKPGRRIYVRADKYPKVKGGKGTLIVSTSKGIMDSKRAQKLKIGGELLAQLF